MKMMKKGLCLVLMLAMLIAAFSMPAFAAGNYTVKATASVNLRKGPSLDYGKITSVSKGKSLTYLGVSSFDSRGVAWHKVSYNGNTAWVSWAYSNLLKDGSAISESNCVKATASVNLRKGAGTNYEKLTTVSKGTKLVYLGEYQTVGGVKWYKVSCSKGIAWVSSKYSQIVKVTATDSPASKTLVTTASVNLRKGPGLGYAKITSVSEGTKFSYITSSTDDRGVKWYKVYYNGGTAWISSRYSKV